MAHPAEKTAISRCPLYPLNCNVLNSNVKDGYEPPCVCNFTKGFTPEEMMKHVLDKHNDDGLYFEVFKAALSLLLKNLNAPGVSQSLLLFLTIYINI